MLGHQSESKRKQIHESEEGGGRRKKKRRLEKIVEWGEHPVEVPELRKWLESPSPSLTYEVKQSSIRKYTIAESELTRRAAVAWVKDLVELAWGRISENREILESMLAIELDTEEFLEQELGIITEIENVPVTEVKKPRGRRNPVTTTMSKKKKQKLEYDALMSKTMRITKWVEKGLRGLHLKKWLLKIFMVVVRSLQEKA